MRTRIVGSPAMQRSSLRAERQVDGDRGPLRAPACDPARASQEARPLPHAREPEPSLGRARIAGEPDAVVADLEVQAALLAPDLDLDRGAPSMARGVGETLLQDPEGRRLDRRRDAAVSD